MTTEDVRDVFSLFDPDETGLVDTEAVGTIVRGLGCYITEAELAEIINEVDEDGTGKVSFAAFYHMFQSREFVGMPHPEDVMAFFDTFDADKDGTVHVETLVRALREMGEPMTEEDVQNLLGELRVTGDKRVVVAEFVEHMFETST